METIGAGRKRIINMEEVASEVMKALNLAPVCMESNTKTRTLKLSMELILTHLLLITEEECALKK